MITARTKMQLVVFLIITLVGCSYVGAKYARLDRLFYDDSFTVTGHFAEAGGIYDGAEVAYRGVKIGQVGELVATDAGVEVKMDIENGYDKIPRDALAIIGNRSALGEQYVDLQPQSDGGPYLKEGSELHEPNPGDWTPISTAALLADVSTTVQDLPQDALTTVIEEMGIAFHDTGDDLGQIIDTSNAFIQTANENFDVTLNLIRDSRIVLDGQLAKASAIRSFSKNLSLFTSTLSGSDKDLRTLIDRGGATATVLRRFLEDHGVEISELLNNLVTTGKVVVRNLDGLRTVLIAFPYVVEGSYSVVSKGDDGKYIASFGLQFTNFPMVCHKGYEGTDRRPPTNGDWREMAVDAHCEEPLPANSRGAQWAPRPAPAGSSPVVASFDQSTGKVTWTDDAPAPAWQPAPATLGDDSWKWLYLQPLGQ